MCTQVGTGMVVCRYQSEKKKVEVHRRPRGKAKRSFIDAVKEDLVLVGVRGCREEFERGG